MAERSSGVIPNPAGAAVDGRIAEDVAFRELLESAPDSILIVDSEGRIVLVNRQVEAVFGYNREDLLGQAVEILLPDRFHRTHVGHRTAYQQAPRTRPMGAGLELFALRHDGSEVPVEISLSPISLDGRQFVISIVRDVTEQKRIEEAQRHQLQQILAIQRQKDELLASITHILNGVSDAIFAVDESGVIMRTNAAASMLMGVPEDRIVGRRAPELFRWEDEAGRLLEEDEYAFRRTIASASSVSVNNVYFRRSDGKRIPVAISSALVADDDRGVRMVVQVVRDISHEREVEDLKNQIISLVSHELRTPIGHIKGFSSSLLDPEVTWDRETERDFIAEIDREADRLAALVRDLLDMSKIESGTAVIEKVESSPAEITLQALKDVERSSNQHELVNLVSDELPNVLADPAQVERVIGNLVENAAKYTPEGTEIRVEAQRKGSMLEWSVSDRGPGVPAEFRQRIF